MNYLNDFIKKANKAVIFISIFIITVLIGGETVQYFKGERSLLEIILISLFTLIPTLSGVILYFKNPYSKWIKLLIGTGFFTMYSYIYLTSNYFVTFAFIFPFLSLFALFANKKDMYFVIGITTILNIIGTIIQVTKHGVDYIGITNYTIQYGVGLTFAASMLVVAHFFERFKLTVIANISEIEENNTKKEKMINELLTTAKLIDVNSKSIYDIIEKNATSSKLIASAVDEISQGTTSTAEDIQSQSILVTHIQNEIKETLNISKEMDSYSKLTVEKINSSLNISNELESKTDIVNNDFDNVSLLMEGLKKKTSDINKIIEVITNIAEETNLLALNAAIESARVGEVGKGFAVVANEIKNLADQTKSSVNNISEIILDVLNETENSVSAVNNLKQANFEQGELVLETKNSLNEINTNILTTREKIEQVNNSIIKISNSNNKINDSISNISAVSEQTMANSQQALSMSTDHINDSNDAMNHINNLIKCNEILKKYTN